MSLKVVSEGLMISFSEGQDEVLNDFPISAVFLKPKISEFGY